MRKAFLRVEQGKNEELITGLYEQISFNYRKVVNDVVILAGEEYRLRTNSNQFKLIIISAKPEHDYLEIDIVCGGGGEGIFSFSWGSENAFVKKAKSIIRDFCGQYNLRYKEVDQFT